MRTGAGWRLYQVAGEKARTNASNPISAEVADVPGAAIAAQKPSGMVPAAALVVVVAGKNMSSKSNPSPFPVFNVCM